MVHSSGLSPILSPDTSSSTTHEQIHGVMLPNTDSSRPQMSFSDFDLPGKLPGVDPFSQVRHVLDRVFNDHASSLTDEQNQAWASLMLEKQSRVGHSHGLISSGKQQEQNRFDRQPGVGSSFLEVGAKTVHSYCEICILVMQMKERGEPHLCAGLASNYYFTCVEAMESLLRADKALVYWLKEGCMHLDTQGPEIVRPCPAINICSWVPNLFTPPPTIVRDEVEALCPKDNRFLPTIPQEYKALL